MDNPIFAIGFSIPIRGSSSGIEMFTGSDSGLNEAYMMPSTGPNPPITLLPPSQMVDYVPSEMVPEVIYDQGLFYPAANYYGYFCTGLEPQREWDGQHSAFGFDGQEYHYPALQAENSPYVYYPPSYGYEQSSYNPYNPYIPGAIMGFDSPIMGAEPYLPNPSYNPPVSSPTAYIPIQPNSGSSINISASIHGRQGSAGSKYSQSRISANGGVISQGAASRIPKSESLQTVGVPPESVNPMTQVSSSNLLPNLRSTVHGWAAVDRSRPRLPFNGALKNGNGNSDILGEQNRGPRTNKAKGQWATSTSDRTPISKCDANNAGEAIVISADQYNRDDFPIDYLDAKFYVIKSYSEDDVHKSIKYSVWSSTPNGNKRLNNAYEEAQRISSGKARKCPVFLFFSVNASGQFCGAAEMIGPVDFHKDMDFWQQDKWTGSFPVKWHIIKDVPNTSFRHIILENNENKPVTNSRDTQEITYVPGMDMLKIFKGSPLKTSILDDFMFYEARQKIMQEGKSRFSGRNCNPYVPAFVSTDKPNDSAKHIDSSDQLAKEDEAHSIISLEQPLKADGSKPDAVKALDDEKGLNPGNEGDVYVEDSVVKMKSLSIGAKEGGKNDDMVDGSTQNDVVTVGSMPVKVNGTVELKARELDDSLEK